MGLRRSRPVGLAKTPLQPLATAAAIHLVRLAAWLSDAPAARTRRSAFARLMRGPAAPAQGVRQQDPSRGRIEGSFRRHLPDRLIADMQRCRQSGGARPHPSEGTGSATRASGSAWTCGPRPSARAPCDCRATRSTRRAPSRSTTPCAPRRDRGSRPPTSSSGAPGGAAPWPTSPDGRRRRPDLERPPGHGAVPSAEHRPGPRAGAPRPTFGPPSEGRRRAAQPGALRA